MRRRQIYQFLHTFGKVAVPVNQFFALPPVQEPLELLQIPLSQIVQPILLNLFNLTMRQLAKSPQPHALLLALLIVLLVAGKCPDVPASPAGMCTLPQLLVVGNVTYASIALMMLAADLDGQQGADLGAEVTGTAPHDVLGLGARDGAGCGGQHRWKNIIDQYQIVIIIVSRSSPPCALTYSYSTAWSCYHQPASRLPPSPPPALPPSPCPRRPAGCHYCQRTA